jgi:hypothetical protein
VSACASTGSVAIVGAPVASDAARYIATIAVTGDGGADGSTGEIAATTLD